MLWSGGRGARGSSCPALFQIAAQWQTGRALVGNLLHIGILQCPQVLHTQLLALVRSDMKAKRAALLATMRTMPDYTMRLSWRMGSSVPGLGLLLRRYAPADTYTIWKVGRVWCRQG